MPPSSPPAPPCPPTPQAFGSLLNTLVTTTRKFFNILLSGGCCPDGLLGCCCWCCDALLSGKPAGSSVLGWGACCRGIREHRRSIVPRPSPHAPAPAAAVLWNANPLLPQQWVAVGLVFSGLLVSSWTKSRRGRHPHAAKHALAPEKVH